MTIAQLGFQVNSAPLVGATKALHDLTAAAKPAAQAAAQIGTASASAATSATNLSNAAHKAASGGAKALTTQTGLARHELINLSRQIQDVGVSLVSGQSFFMVLAQQGAQVADIFGSSKTGTVGGAMRQIGSGILSVITPMRLLGVGVAAAGAAVAASLMSWKNYALQLDDVRRLTGTTSTALAGLNSAAAIKGIGDDEFFGGMKAFSQSVYEAKINMGSLAPLLRVNGSAAKDVQGTFGKVADLVKNAKDDVQRMNILQQAGLPATRQWIDFMSQGSAKIQLIAAGMKSLGGSDNDAMIEAAKRFDEKWNEIWRNMTNGMKSFGLGFINKLDEITNSQAWKVFLGGIALMNNIRAINSGMIVGGVPVDKGTAPIAADGSATLRTAMANRSDTANSRVADAFSAVAEAQKKSNETKNPDDLINANRMAQQRISMLGELATVADQVRAKELELNAAWLQGGVGVGKYKDAILNLVRAQAEMSRVQQQASIGVFNLNDANKAAADTLQTWIDKKLLDPTNAEQLAAAHNMLARSTRELSDAAKVAGSNMPGLQQAINTASDVNKQIDQFATSSFSTITTGLTDIFDGTKTASQGFADLGKTVMRSLEEMLIKMYIVMPIFNSLKGILGGGLGGLGGGLASLIPSANGNVFPANDNGISRYSNSVVSSPTLFAFANGVGLMGEAGAEAIMPLRRGADGKLGVAASGAGGGGKTTINVIGAPNPQNVRVEETVDGHGNRDIKIHMDDQVAAALSRPGSNTRKAMGSNFGARPVGVRR